MHYLPCECRGLIGCSRHHSLYKLHSAAACSLQTMVHLPPRYLSSPFRASLQSPRKKDIYEYDSSFLFYCSHKAQQWVMCKLSSTFSLTPPLFSNSIEQFCKAKGGGKKPLRFYTFLYCSFPFFPHKAQQGVGYKLPVQSLASSPFFPVPPKQYLSRHCFHSCTTTIKLPSLHLQQTGRAFITARAILLDASSPLPLPSSSPPQLPASHI